MALEFNRIMTQVQKMGAMIRAVDFDLGDKIELALERFAQAGDLDKTYDYIRIVRGSQISGYRGAALLEPPHGAPVNLIYPPVEPPPLATLIAADGSQVYPDELLPVHFYLLNTGLFIYHHGQDRVPEGITEPELFYHRTVVYDDANRLVNNRTVDARRTVREMQHLAQCAWEVKRAGDCAEPIIALYDNHLLFMANTDITDNRTILKDYLGALQQLRDAGAILGGYIDHPYRSRVVLRLLYLLSLSGEAEIRAKQALLARSGDLEGLRDIHLFEAVLEPGERSAIMVQNSPRNAEYRERNPSFEVAFFYVKVHNGFRTAIARVDIPAWVARDSAAVDALHGLILAQCQMQGRTPYPYALARADELALVSSKDKRKLNELVNLELRRHGLQPSPLPAKDQSKKAARSEKRLYDSRPKTL